MAKDGGLTRAELRARIERPTQRETVWFLGWEIGYDSDAAYWAGLGWRAYKGGADLDASSLSSATFENLLDQIEDEEA